MHGHGSARAERVRSDVFWGESKSGRSHSQTLSPDGGDDAGCADRAEAMIGGTFSSEGGGMASPIAQAEEDVNAHSNWAGCQ